MDKQEIKKAIGQIKKLKRLVTEINQLIPLIKKKQDISTIKETVTIISGLIAVSESEIEFECNKCHSSVKNGKCTGCKHNYISGGLLP